MSSFLSAFCASFRPFSRVFGVVTVFLVASLFSVASVQAKAVEGRVCTMSGSLGFAGPLTKQDEEHDVFGEATISACVDENGPMEGVEAQVLFTGDGIANCTLQSFTLSQAVVWNDGQFDLATLQAPHGGPAPLGSYKGVVDFGPSEGNKVITVLFNEEPLQTLSCLLGIDPIGTYSFRGVQIFTDLEANH